ncbi:MAG TPA: hypothetical protein VJ464_21365 [Blastocatellia bacterium]|nr:hypothetical protein [Blastocatellia bacterium]
MSAFADDNVPLRISARGGFRYGTDALDKPSALTNRFWFIVGGKPFDQDNKFSVSAVVVEPRLVVSKSISGFDTAGHNYCTVTLKNTGTTDAFDIHLTDALPVGVTLSGSPTVSVAPLGCASPTVSVTTVSGFTTIVVDMPRHAATRRLRLSGERSAGQGGRRAVLPGEFLRERRR